MSYKQFREIVYGREDEFDLKEIIFHQICFISAIALGIGLLLSINIRQWDLVLVVLGTLLVLVLCYWFSRVMGLFKVGWYIFLISSYLLFVFTYFLNSGINGATIILSLMTLAMLFATTDSKAHWFWTLVHGIVFSGLLLYEYYYGREYIVGYETEELRYIDMVLSYLLTLGLFYMVFRLIRQAYEMQRQKVEDQKIELQQSQKELQESYKELTKVLSIIAHDVRNPLASIESYLELARDGAIPEEDRMELKGELLKMVQNTSHMLDDMVNWSKSQIAGNHANFHLVSLGSWLNQTVEHLRGMAKAKGILFKDDYNGQEKVFCDPILMTVVIRNLLQNAVKFTPSGKEISLKVRSSKNAVLFTVSDQGLGISAEKQKNLFNGRTESVPGTQQERGSGFGLLIVKEYVDLHQGSISVESSPGKGSTFAVSIPFKPH